MTSLLIKNGRVINPAKKFDKIANILIVDDIEPNVILLETTLRHLKANIIRAYSGQEAYSASDEKPHID